MRQVNIYAVYFIFNTCNIKFSLRVGWEKKDAGDMYYTSGSHLKREITKQNQFDTGKPVFLQTRRLVLRTYTPIFQLENKYFSLWRGLRRREGDLANGLTVYTVQAIGLVNIPFFQCFGSYWIRIQKSSWSGFFFLVYGSGSRYLKKHFQMSKASKEH